MVVDFDKYLVWLGNEMHKMYSLIKAWDKEWCIRVPDKVLTVSHSIFFFFNSFYFCIFLRYAYPLIHVSFFFFCNV